MGTASEPPKSDFCSGVESFSFWEDHTKPVNLKVEAPHVKDISLRSHRHGLPHNLSPGASEMGRNLSVWGLASKGHPADARTHRVNLWGVTQLGSGSTFLSV